VCACVCVCFRAWLRSTNWAPPSYKIASDGADALARGDIDEDAMRYYLIQDHRFLDDFVVLLASMVSLSVCIHVVRVLFLDGLRLLSHLMPPHMIHTHVHVHTTGCSCADPQRPDTWVCVCVFRSLRLWMWLCLSVCLCLCLCQAVAVAVFVYVCHLLSHLPSRRRSVICVVSITFTFEKHAHISVEHALVKCCNILCN
jgi:hypothetical protein